MARRFRSSFVLPSLFVCSSVASTWAAAPPQVQPAKADTIAPITLGQSVVPLYGPWRFQVGDAPVDPVTHAPLWAEPDFDDSKWETVDLTPENGVLDPVTGQMGYVPGWTARGHAGYWGYAWYRIRVHLESRPRWEAGPGRAARHLRQNRLTARRQRTPQWSWKVYNFVQPGRHDEFPGYSSLKRPRILPNCSREDRIRDGPYKGLR